MWGTIVNVLAILGGSLAGHLGGGMISENTKDTVGKAVALGVILIGLQMAFATEHMVLVLLSLVIGGLIGEGIKIEDKLNSWAIMMESRFSFIPGKRNLSKGFVTATLIYCVGAMAIMGSLQSGLTGDHEILYAKSVLDGTTSVVLASTLGFGVALSAIPLFLYQGAITLMAGWIQPYIIQEAIVEMKATGGLLILAIGFNMLGALNIRVGNLLPSVILAILFTTLLLKF